MWGEYSDKDHSSSVQLGGGDSLDRAAQVPSIVTSPCKCPATRRPLGASFVVSKNQRCMLELIQIYSCFPQRTVRCDRTLSAFRDRELPRRHKTGCKWMQLWNCSTKENSYRSKTTQAEPRASGHLLPTPRNGFSCCCCETSQFS